MTRARCILILCLAMFAPTPRSDGAEALDAGTHSQAPKRSAELAITDEAGKSIPLFSTDAYRAEFRYLRRKLREIDLSGPAVQTDGWTHNIAEAEWPFIAFAYFGYACANLAVIDDTIRLDALAETRRLIEALQTPRLSGFVTPHFGSPFGTNQMKASVFVHGHFLNLALRYREVSGDARYDVLVHRVADALIAAFQQDKQGVLKSYRTMWWLSDNLPALSALARYDRLHHRDTAFAREKFLRSVRVHYLDEATGLLCTYVDADATRQLQGPRGISTTYGLHFLRDVAPDFAVDQYRRARMEFVREGFGLAAVREFPAGVDGASDIDSGPVLLGFGPSASGFAIAAAAVMKDRTTAVALLKASALAGMPEWHAEELRYQTMPTVGQAVILFGKTELFREPPK